MAARLFAVFLLARAIALWGRALPLSPWTPLAFIWQDVAVALGFLLIERAVRRRGAVLALYAAVVLVVIASVPMTRVLSSPVTAPMLGAARGALADSFRYHATAGNLGSIIAVLGLAVGLLLVRGSERIRASMGSRGGWALAAVGVAVVLAGPYASARVDTMGLERNPVLALVQTSLPRVHAEPAHENWRASPFGTVQREPLTHLRAAASAHNVVMVVLESTGARYLRSYGAAQDPTPNLTALARRSIVFEHAYAVYPESVKGLVPLLASRYPGFGLAAKDHAQLLRPTLATQLSRAGYATGLFHSGRFAYLGMDTLVASAGFDRAEDAGAIGGNHESSFGVDEASAVRRILQWIDALPAGRPFFALYLPIAGHHPYTASIPGPFPEEEEIGRYRNALHEGDRALGELLRGLGKRGLENNTLVIVAGDHGEAFGQHDGNYGHSLAIYDENLRVPLVISLPRTPAPVRVQRTASLIDLAPTTLDLLGLEQPSAFDGASLLDGSERMALFFADYSLGLLGLRDGCIKFMHVLETGRSSAFDLCRDPDERRDVSAALAARTSAYRERLRRWSAAQVARIER